MAFKYFNGFPGLGLIQYDDHSDAHVEDVEHLPMGDAAPLFQERENGQNLPASFLYFTSLSIAKNPWDILVESPVMWQIPWTSHL